MKCAPHSYASASVLVSAYLILPCVQIHDQILWFWISITNLAFVTMLINCHFIWIECEIWVFMTGLCRHSNLYLGLCLCWKNRDSIANKSEYIFSFGTAKTVDLITFAWSANAILHVDIDADDITAVWMLLSFGLSLPSDTGCGLSEHGDASRETISESSSLNTAPAIENAYQVFLQL